MKWKEAAQHMDILRYFPWLDSHLPLSYHTEWTGSCWTELQVNQVKLSQVNSYEPLLFFLFHCLVVILASIIVLVVVWGSVGSNFVLSLFTIILQLWTLSLSLWLRGCLHWSQSSFLIVDTICSLLLYSRILFCSVLFGFCFPFWCCLICCIAV